MDLLHHHHLDIHSDNRAHSGKSSRSDLWSLCSHIFLVGSGDVHTRDLEAESTEVWPSLVYFGKEPD